MRFAILGLTFLISFSTIAIDIDVKVVGLHDYHQGKPVLLQVPGTECYYMAVSDNEKLIVVGKSCVMNDGVESQQFTGEVYVTYPIQAGEMLTIDVVAK